MRTGQGLGGTEEVGGRRPSMDLERGSTARGRVNDAPLAPAASVPVGVAKAS